MDQADIFDLKERKEGRKEGQITLETCASRHSLNGAGARAEGGRSNGGSIKLINARWVKEEMVATALKGGAEVSLEIALEML